jgi:tRNA G10  N-methylase Trm11
LAWAIWRSRGDRTPEEVYVLGHGFSGHRGTSVLSYHAISPNFVQRDHPTEKPVALMLDLIAKCPKGCVLDPFMGVGTTLVAAKRMNRCAIGIEIDERYCEIAAERLRQDALPLEVA